MQSLRERRAADQRTRYSAIENGLLRTQAPKHANYFGDGSGRDSYVVTNCGGLMDSDKHGMLNRPFRNSFRNRVAMVSPQKAVMPVYYHSDGTGRDSYVIRGSGGMTSEFPITTRADVNFVGSLRQQTIRDLPRHFRREDITNYLNCHDARNRKCLVEAARKVANITERLSTNGSMENLHPNTHSPSVRNLNDNWF